MKFRWLVIAGAGLACVATALAAADPAMARQKYRIKPPQCVDRPRPLSWDFLLPGGSSGQYPNGCAPPAYAYGQYVGQDPDPFIRLYMMRDPAAGASGGMAR